MQIKIAKHSGFCEGVERAHKIALEQTKAGSQVFMLGKLVHNTQVIERFEKAGVKTVKAISEIPANSQGILLISTHGVPPEIYTEAKAKGLGVIDTTCPWVKKAQKIAGEFAKEGRQVIIVGDKGHTEVKGLLGWSLGKGKVIEVIEDIEEIGDIKETKGIKVDKIGILAQTTQSEEHFQKIVAATKQKFPDVKASDTICGATSKRQSAATELAQQVDLMLVIGDKMSANTKRLTELCSKTGTETHQIQTVEELDSNWLKNKQKIGLTAGASTPNWVIEKVIAKLKNLC
ncbi:MAG: 4-hydroxy-3-methylbut-2-enyl diphosphate reductase [bacterium]